MLRKRFEFAAVPPDVRKGSAFPSKFLNFLCGYAANQGVASESWDKPFGKAQPFRTSVGEALESKFA